MQYKKLLRSFLYCHGLHRFSQIKIQWFSSVLIRVIRGKPIIHTLNKKK